MVSLCKILKLFLNEMCEQRCVSIKHENILLAAFKNEILIKIVIMKNNLVIIARVTGFLF